MHSTQNTPQYTSSTNKLASVATPINGVVAMGVAGALVTGSVAAASEIRKVREDKADNVQALVKVGKEALGGGLAWAAGAAVAKTVFRSNILGILTMVAVSAGVKYAYDGLTSPKAAAGESVEPAKGKKVSS